MKKRIVLYVVAPLLLASCGGSSGSGEDVQDFEAKLVKLEGLTSYRKITIEAANQSKNHYPNAYLLNFETPIDWHNPSLGSFNQRVYIGYRGLDKVNTYLVGGYCLYDAAYSNYFQICPGNELSNRYDGNFIAIEYRFFYQSQPTDFSVLGTKYLDYLNSEEACDDFHRIISSLHRILPGKSIFTGTSKGGYTTEAMAYYYPDDIDSYVSYVAPLCEGTEDERFYHYVYHEIGNGGLGEVEASHRRKLLLDFSRYALKETSRNTYLAWLKESLATPGFSWTGRASLNELWEAAVGETSVSSWQYNNGFEKLEQILAMEEEEESEKQAKEKAVYDHVIKDMDFLSNVDQQGPLFPYYFQCYSEMGNYAYDFEYLKEAGCYITTSEEDQKDLFMRATLSEEQESYLTYSPSFRNRMIDFLNTTDKEIVKIVGYNDPWYSVKDPETENPHVHLYKENGCHTSTINALDEASKNACWAIIDNLVQSI